MTDGVQVAIKTLTYPLDIAPEGQPDRGDIQSSVRVLVWKYLGPGPFDGWWRQIGRFIEAMTDPS